MSAPDYSYAVRASLHAWYTARRLCGQGIGTWETVAAHEAVLALELDAFHAERAATQRAVDEKFDAGLAR